MEIDTFPPLRDVWFLTGATATGKTRVGLALAKAIGAEIISLDSMAIYRGMDVGTAKPSAADQAQIPHHLIDIADPCEEFSISEYVAAAHAATRDVRIRGRIPLFVGGTPLYLKALLRGLFPGPPADWDFRREVEREVELVGLPALHQRLELIDPLTASRLHPHDKRRIIRALEVYKATGRPLSHEQTQFDDAASHSVCAYALRWERERLHRRIEQRVEGMFANGLVEEVKGLPEKFGQLSKTALQAVGYREVLAYVNGELELPETIDSVKARTRQFARRQETWFRSLSECQPVPLSQEDSAENAAEKILASRGH